jgi:hypothetical protein
MKMNWERLFHRLGIESFPSNDNRHAMARYLPTLMPTFSRLRLRKGIDPENGIFIAARYD